MSFKQFRNQISLCICVKCFYFIYRFSYHYFRILDRRIHQWLLNLSPVIFLVNYLKNHRILQLLLFNFIFCLCNFIYRNNRCLAFLLKLLNNNFFCLKSYSSLIYFNFGSLWINRYDNFRLITTLFCLPLFCLLLLALIFFNLLFCLLILILLFNSICLYIDTTW